MPNNKRLMGKPRAMNRNYKEHKAELTWEQMNRQQRRKAKSKKGGMYRGLKRPTDDGVANGGKKRYG